MDKTCRGCGELKEVIHFSKCKSLPDGLQYKCKQCNKIDNKLFNVTNPKYFWGEDSSYFVKDNKKNTKYIKEYRRGNKQCIIYAISSDDGIYVGFTKCHLSVRMQGHHTDYTIRHGYLKNLHAAFDKYGFEELRSKVIILEQFDGTREDGLEAETKWIHFLQQFNNVLNIKKINKV
jgi:hypothetical protein